MKSLDPWPERVDADLLRRLESRIDVPPDRERLPVIAPFTGEQIGSVPQATQEDVVAATGAARRAQERWSRLSMETKVRIFTRFHDLLIERADQAMDLIQLEAGKSRVPAFEEVFDVVGATRYYLNSARGDMGRWESSSTPSLRRLRYSAGCPLSLRRHPVSATTLTSGSSLPRSSCCVGFRSTNRRGSKCD